MRSLKVFVIADGIISMQNTRITFILYREINESADIEINE